MKYKNWIISQLDSGHWIAEYENKTSPMFPYKYAVRMWIRNYLKKQVKGIRI